MSTLQEDMRKLRALKDTAEEAGREKSAADEAFKRHQARCIGRAGDEETDTVGTGGYLYSVVTKVKGQIEDRREFIRWALQQDEGVQDWLQRVLDAISGETYGDECGEEIVADFYDVMMNTMLVELKPDTTELNRIANRHIDDDAPLPPGVTFRPDSYISMRKR